MLLDLSWDYSTLNFACVYLEIFDIGERIAQVSRLQVRILEVENCLANFRLMTPGKHSIFRCIDVSCR